MSGIEKVKSFLVENKKLVVAVASAFLALLFVGSILLAVFVGGEFGVKVESNEVKGLLQLEQSSYTTDYISGDKFSFDKEKSKVRLIAKDPLIEDIVKVDSLPASEYGFRIGDGEIFDNAEDIVLTADVKTVSVVSKYYPNLKTDIAVNVVSMDGVELTKELLLEAETAKLYNEGKLVEEEDKHTQPEADKPFNSASGTAQGADCSGGACLRNLGTRNIRVSFDVVCTEETEVKLVIKYCRRPDGKTFGEYFKVKVNGVTNTEIASLKTTASESGQYFTPEDLQTVTLKFKKGVNTVTFESGPNVGTQNPVNLDALLFTCDAAVIGVAA
ncbi:MAG: hypothetical protein HFK08_03915 [Clostridia bacterium]|nr:hypothetical protein [Clostridia bacterium]